ncbi:alpha-L-arabinofuranosidase C-terminal domain-containing protein [Phocaeicola plebeius]|uniref:alpha-L-arabinofuranosidase C-terminal domain-containing protein n=1 Tax=Phocaeicola plebeius TaxID=310297 RepID=UPI003F9B703F
MKKLVLYVIIFFISSHTLLGAVKGILNLPDSVYIFPYTRSGGWCHLAWSSDGKYWNDLGNKFRFFRSDFGNRKIMINPRLIKGADGVWHGIWQLSTTGKAYGYTCSLDLIRWTPQVYFEKGDESYEKYSVYINEALGGIKQQIVLSGDTLCGYVQSISRKHLENILAYVTYKQVCMRNESERMEQDSVRFADLNSVKVSIDIHRNQVKSISDNLIGVFFEDLNYAADGGLYAELIQNRDFEYSSKDGNPDKEWNSKYAWSVEGENIFFDIDRKDPILFNNIHYAVLDVKSPGGKFCNKGFDGIVLQKNEKYDFSFFVKVLDGGRSRFKIALIGNDNKELAKTVITTIGHEWKQKKAVLTAREGADNAKLIITPLDNGRYGLDMVSLFPQRTFKNRKNGLRADLAQMIADLKPKFVRFPGGCLAHGDGLDNIYDWKGSIGPLEARKPLPNIWRYHQTRGLGYFEYFQFCEDIGAEPIPVIAAGVCCQNSGTCSSYSWGEVGCGGQQRGIPMDKMDAYIQDILDLIEYANGDSQNTKWGKIRAESGHPKPFNLKYIGIGNEDIITDVFKERFAMIYHAVKRKYPEITIIGTSGPSCEGSDYEEGWNFADKLNLSMVDEHYYRTPGWFIHNQGFYDFYDRDKSKVYLGEYAAHLPGGPNNIETALSEALYLISIERNADIVDMVSYAPLLAKEGHIQWKPDLIYFNNKEAKPTVNYYVQQLFSNYGGDEYIASSVRLNKNRDDVKQRVAVSFVRDSQTGNMVLKLVNLLPVSVESEIFIPGISPQKSVQIVLKGNPKDETVRPNYSDIQLKEKFIYKLPAYSFTVIPIVNK